MAARPTPGSWASTRPRPSSPAARPRASSAGQATRALGKKIAAAHEIRLSGGGRDRYGRLLVTLWLDGRDVAGEMIAEGLAVPYDGGRRINWCARLG